MSDSDYFQRRKRKTIRADLEQLSALPKHSKSHAYMIVAALALVDELETGPGPMTLVVLKRTLDAIRFCDESDNFLDELKACLAWHDARLLPEGLGPPRDALERYGTYLARLPALPEDEGNWPRVRDW